MYEPLKNIKGQKDKGPQKRFESDLVERNVSVALGQLAQVAIHLARCLSIPLKHPIIYNAHRSYAVFVDEKETKVVPLYISYENKNRDYKNITFAVELIEQNLRTILRTLERLKDRQGIGKIPESIQSAQ